MTKPVRIKSISEFHRLRGLSKPEHPLISIVTKEDFTGLPNQSTMSAVFDFYFIALKHMQGVKYKYGQLLYDFEDGGVLFFMSPNQVLDIEINEKERSGEPSGWMLLIHPDFIWNTQLAKGIKKYDFFDYSVNEALLLSEKEEGTLNGIIENIRQEYRANIDKFTKQIIISHVEALLNYSERFYNRQFITREKAHHQLLERLEKLLTDYFNSDDLISKGLPTVQYVAAELNVSPGYLGSLLRALTGQNTQQHIHDKLIEKAREKLSTTNLSVSEIAYELGFEHSQSFSKLFKTKTNVSPLKFRQSFN
ncbi:helix-turn-helix domain-containing protein [Parapedobacter indicus]|uniref:Transcriptional regulator, AraC family n=1 Tax=Parapedobacter indicus TaxID=1477437 RepID=A0A1I3R6D4_9SPHI|nr:helix-turn-helix transcriptional regulator [Parapedobacter indicus]PPL00344.1 AraC family transcriptional regulator [Parapedobacter indicus]SFJ40816.1 transcriptional regulator, AraC family [Parapedobacter indicus]